MTQVIKNMDRMPEVLQGQRQTYRKPGCCNRWTRRRLLGELKKTYVMADQHVIHEGGKVEQKNTTDISFFLEGRAMAKTIMIVDDSASMRGSWALRSRVQATTVLEGSDGKDALAKLTGQKVHMIISDVNMPNMDGITFLKAVKQLPSLQVHPGHHADHRVGRGEKARRPGRRRRAWVVKPFQPEQLIGAVQRLCLP
jgi:two-component system chemotaxis response regulator CheY